MKRFIFIITLATGIAFKCAGEGCNKDVALMDACLQLSLSVEHQEDDVEFIDLLAEEEQA